MKQLINILVVLAIIPLLVLGAVNVFAPLNTFELYGLNH
jgi:hypothetical protein